MYNGIAPSSRANGSPAEKLRMGMPFNSESSERGHWGPWGGTATGSEKTSVILVE